MTLGAALGSFFLIFVCLGVAGACGLIARSIAPPILPEKSTAFAWGFAFGPIGIAVVAWRRGRTKEQAVGSAF